MKKIFIIFLSLTLITGCSFFKSEDDKKVKDNVIKNDNSNDNFEDKNEEVIPSYIDDNVIKIGLYERNGSTLKLLSEYNSKIETKKDIKTFQAFPSNDLEINHSGEKYANYYYKVWNDVNPEKKYKVGFNLSYTLVDGTSISQNILNPSTTQTNYLYDAYKHRNDSFYSHIEEYEYNDETLITSIKLTAGSKFNDIKSKITLTVFTYDEDDFDENNMYRGNSKYSVIISDLNKTYEE